MEERRLDGQVAVVTGAGRGLGRAYAHLLAERGASVVVNNRVRPEHAKRRPVAEDVVAEITAQGGSAVADTTDIGDGPDATAAVAQAALEAFGSIDIVVNNAGVVHFYEFADYPRDEFARMLAIHLHGTWNVTRAAWPHMRDQGYGRVLNTVSRGAFFGDPQGAAYAAAKGAIYGLTRALAVEGRAHGIKVNAISPTAWTPMYASAPDVDAERRRFLEENFPPELVAPVVVALTHESCPTTGEVFVAAGGNVSRIFAAQTSGAEVGHEFDAEEFTERLPEIWSEDDYVAIGLVTPGQRAQRTPVAEVPDEVRRALQAQNDLTM